MNNKKLLPHHAENWNGYSLDELRYQRAVTMARIEIEKEKLAVGIDDLRQGIPFVGGGRGLLSKIAGSLNYIDYAMLAFRAFRSASKLFRSLRRH